MINPAEARMAPGTASEYLVHTSATAPECPWITTVHDEYAKSPDCSQSQWDQKHQTPVPPVWLLQVTPKRSQ